MDKLSDLQIARQDFVDGQIFQLLQSINPSSKIIKWDIEMIGDVRDTIKDWIVNKLKICTEKDFYPYIEKENGN